MKDEEVVGVVGHGAESCPGVLRAFTTTTSSGGSSSSSSPSSAESSFRELDDVFLQNQTRIWLGEVLRTRLNEQLNIADLLADGELLFEVSREIWKMLSTNEMEIRFAKAYKYEPFASRKCSGRYMPYSNVDLFLKICKILGLAGIDLFSPSDVVEKRDTRKVCMCIRSLSMKARSRHLNVPDFDIVTYTITMPTDMVGYIRRSWELSHCSSSSSASHSAYHASRHRSRQKHSNAASGRDYDGEPEEYEDTGSNLVLQFDGSASSCSYNNSSQMNADLINSAGASLLTKTYSLKQNSLQVYDQNPQKDEKFECQWDAICSNDFPGYLDPQYLEYYDEQDCIPSPSFVDSIIHLGGRVSHTENIARDSYKNTAQDLIYVDSNMESGASVVGDSANGCTPRRHHIDDHSAMAGIICHGTYTNHSSLHDRDDFLSHVHASTGSCCSKSTRSSSQSEFGSRSSYVNDVEVSSIASMSSVSGAVRNLDFDCCLDAEDDTKHEWFPESPNNIIDLGNLKPVRGSKLQDKVECETQEHRLTTDNEEVEAHPPSDMEVKDTGFSSMHFLPCSDVQYTTGYLGHAFSHNNGVCISQINSNGHSFKELLASHSCYPFELQQWDQKGKCRIPEVPRRDDGHGASTVSISLLDSHEIIHFNHHKGAGGGLWIKSIKSVITDNDKEVHCATTVESDKTMEALEIVESGNFHQPGCMDDDSGFHHQDTVICHGTHVLDRVTCTHSNSFVCHSPGEPKPDQPTCLVTELSQNVDDNSGQVFTDQKKDLIYSADNIDKDDEKYEKAKKLTAENSDGAKDLISDKVERKSQRRALLKSVAKGTAVLGVLLFVLHLRKKGREQTGESGKQSNEIRKQSRNSSSALQGRKGRRADGIYPAEKLKFGG